MLANSLFQKRSTYYPVHPNPGDPALSKWFAGYGSTASGKNVTEDSAIKLVAVFTAIRILSETVASLPITINRVKSDGSKEEARNHYLWKKLKRKANQNQTAFTYFEMSMGHAALRGNAYTEIVSSPIEAVSQLVPLHPDRVYPFIAPDGKVNYEYTDKQGKKRIILNNEMMHVPALHFDGIKGIDPITVASEAIGLGLAADEFGGKFFGNGTILSGTLKSPNSLSDKAYGRIKESWEKRHSGSANAHKFAILEEGLEWQQMSLSPEQAQFILTRKFQITEIARLFRIPPHMLADLERATFSNIEEQGLEFVIYTLRPWLVRFEQAMNTSLLSEREQDKYQIEFNVDGLLRGNTAARTQFYKEMWGIGVLNPNQILKKESMNPRTDPGGDEYFRPLNMQGSNSPITKDPVKDIPQDKTNVA